MNTYNPDMCAANEVLSEAQAARVESEYLDYFRTFPCDRDMSITERRKLIQEITKVKYGSQSNPAIDTAKAGILNALQDLEYGEITIPMFHQAINTILEALVEDVRANAGLERKERP